MAACLDSSGPVHRVRTHRRGDTRVRFRHRQTPVASSQKLVDLDLEIRNALALPLSAELKLELRRLTARLRALDPH